MWFVPSAADISDLTDAAKCDALLNHARGLIDKGKFDYAVAIVRALAIQTPHRLDYRKLLWKALKGSGGLKAGPSPPNVLGRRLLAEAKEKGDWNAVADVVDVCLVYEPLDGTLHLDLGNAYRHRGMREHAIFAYQCAYELLPTRADIRETLDELLKS